MQRRTPLARTSPGLSRSHRLPATSAGQRAGRAEKAKVYRQLDEAQPWCQACGGHWMLEHSHILTEKKFGHHRANPENILRLCHTCHRSWEHNKAEFKAHYPAVWARHLDVMQRLEPSYYAHFCMKFPHLVP